VLGSGDPMIPGQDFTLTKSPVTYFADPASLSGDGFSSTVKVSVNGVLWSEARSFYGQPPDAQVFVLREDDQGKTHVTFGDGVNGARLPTGINNIVASYRYGAGAEAPPPETLTSVLTPVPGLKGVRNPISPTGGADADPPAKLATLAPRSVLTFNRAVSLDDYAAIAAGAAGVTQAVADFAFDPVSQRPQVTLWVAGDDGALAAATTKVTAVAVPNQPLNIQPAKPVEAGLSLAYVRDPRYADDAVQAGLTRALLDPDSGLLGVNVIGIGQAVYDSQISAACLAVPGVVAIEDVELITPQGQQFTPLIRWFGRLDKLRIGAPGCTGRRHDPGAGAYFQVADDGRHLRLQQAAAP
jgi:predicted phage baseplate assembly protein